MTGICVTLNCEEINKMANSLLTNPNLEQKDIYIDPNIGISQVSLKKNKFGMFKKENVVIFIEGYCYNIDECNKIFNINECRFEGLLFEAYKNSYVFELLKHVDGCFHAVIYDEIKKKIYLITDRYGTRFLYFYHKDNIFAASGEVKGILSLDKTEKVIDKTSIDCFVNNDVNWYLLGDNTLFENVKLLNQSTILEYDIANNSISQNYYWKFSDIKQQNITYENAIDVLHNLVERAVLKRIENINLNDTMFPLSGGLDSRLVFAILNNHNKVPAYIYTNGAKDCTDVIYAKKLCHKYGFKHNINSLIQYSNYLETGKKAPWETDGMLIFFENSSYNFISEYHYTINGYLGDMVLGESFKDDKSVFDKRMNKNIAQKFYGRFHKLSNYEDDYFDINKIEAHLLMNRVRRYTAQMVNVGYNYNEYLLPFIDNKIIEFIYSIPDEYRANNQLYSDMLLKYYSEYFKNIPWNKYNLLISGKIYKNNKGNVNEVIDKINDCNFISRKWKRSIIKRIDPSRKSYKKTFHIFDTELRKISNKNLILNEYLGENCILKQYISENTWKEIEEYLASFDTWTDLWKISQALTIEFYLRDLKNKKYI